jgi:two-component system, OmpR family, response regulator
MTSPSSARHPPDEFASNSQIKLRELPLTRQVAQADDSQAMARVLVIDDEPKIVDFVSRALSANGLEVETATDGARGLELARTGSYDLVILDLMMPGVSGMGVLRGTIEALPQQRVLVLSALSDVESKVRCLELGAADYLTKPFALAELVARVWARLRLTTQSSSDGLVRAGGLTLDPHRRTADAGDGPVALSAREFLLLKHLAVKEGDVCTRSELLEEVWGCTFDPGTNVVDVYIRRLRAKLGTAVVETIRNVGYCLPHRAAAAS